MTCGPYRTVELTSYDACLGEFHPRPRVNINQDGSFQANLVVDANVEGDFDNLFLDITLLQSDGGLIRKERALISSAKAKITTTWDDLQLDGIKLWWPVKYGEQPLYTVLLELFTEVRIISS